MSEPFERPADWPGPGAIDLAVHDLPHASATTEWWYVNGHVKTADGRNFSLFASFFRQVKGMDPDGAFQHVYSLTWALMDIDEEHNFFVSRVDDSAAKEGLLRMQRGIGSKDPRLNRSLKEILERGNVPTPDRVFEGPVDCPLDRLDLRYGPDRFYRMDNGHYGLELFDKRQDVGCKIEFEPLKDVVRHGDDGLVRGPDDERMFYYFCTRNKLTGTLTIDGEQLEITEGQAWRDHEFGVGEVEDIDDGAEAKLDAAVRQKTQAARLAARDERAVGWDWLSVQFEDGTEMSVYVLTYPFAGKSAGNHTVMIDADGTGTAIQDDALFEASSWWKSTQTFFDYPNAWRVRVPKAGVDLQVKAAFNDQEFITLISKPSFWEGRVLVEGTVDGKPMKGVGIIERSGFAPFETLEGFFEEVGKVVRSSVSNMLPLQPTFEQARDLIASEETERYMAGVDTQQYADTLLKPIREIVDRGGKGWRSYAAITCCDIVGGDSRQFTQWLALPEMLHVGSLIIDDVQDKSVVRRGGPTAHLLFGEAHAINSGTAAYFLGQRLLDSDLLSDKDQVRLYELFFDTMRAGHAGQAIDLEGHDDYVKQVVETGDVSVLEARVLAIHRLKTAVPAGCLAQMGAIGGGGTPEQVDALGRFFEDLGLAFQIIDDVLNIRGFKGNLKDKAEDIVQGKITLPVVKTLGRVDRAEREWLVHTLSTKPQDPKVVQEVVDKLEACDSVQDCHEQARALVEGGWDRISPLIEDSLAKMMLRAFGWFILERHY